MADAAEDVLEPRVEDTEAAHEEETADAPQEEAGDDGARKGKMLPTPPGGKPRKSNLVPKFSRAGSKLKGAALARSRVSVEHNKAAKESKDVKPGATSRLDARHKYVLGCVADLMAQDAASVETSVCLDEMHIDLMDSFFAKDGQICLLFWQKKAGAKTLVQVSAGSLEETAAVTGTCVYVTRSTTKPITPANLGTDVNFGAITIDEKDRASVLAALDELMSRIVLPFMEGNENWGKLQRNQGETKAAFLDTLARFQTSLAEATLAVRESVILEAPPAGVNLAAYRSPKDFAAAAEDAALVSKLEALLTSWIQQISRLIAQSEQMRKEADNVGPRAELEHWKYRMAKFNGLLDQIKDAQCTTVVSILQMAKLRGLLDQWRALDARITEEANEAKDNVKYLYTLQKFCQPLYKASPSEMIEAVPGLLNAVSMIHSVSRYYNTNERMTALLVKITNQMINACHQYIYGEEPRVWEISPQVLFPKFDDIKKLNQQYQACFYKEKEKLALNPAGRQFDFSEMSIFGKFDGLCRRMEKVRHIFGLMDDWGRLSYSKIEKLEPINAAFRTQVANLKKKPYDPLNTRKPDFDADYDAFLQDTEDLLHQLQAFMDAQFVVIPSTMRALHTLSKFEKIKHVGLELEAKYQAVFTAFGQELEELKTVYQRDRNEPPIARNLPPMSGRIAWARQLFARIEGPMTQFQTVAPQLLATANGKKTIKNYNKIGHVLMEYEMVYHRAWWRAVDQAQTGLQASLLVRNAETEEIVVNFDPELLQLVRETAVMEKLKLEIPESATILGLQAHRLKHHESQLQQLIAEYKRVLGLVPPICATLLQPVRSKVDAALAPGFTQLSWMSVNLDAFLQAAYREIEALELHLKQLSDILVVRIEGAFEAVAQTQLCTLSADSAMEMAEFSAAVATGCEQETAKLQRHSELACKAVAELLAVIRAKVPAGALTDRLEAEFTATQQAFAQRNTESLIRCIRGSLNSLKRRLTTSSSQGYSTDAGGAGNSDAAARPPLFRARVNLNIPNITMTPQLDDIQQAVSKACELMINVSKQVPRWNSKGHHFSAVSENKDVVKIMSSLSSAINVTKQDVQDALDRLSKYNRLWQDDRDAKLKEFAASNPDLSDYEFAVRQYDNTETEIEAIPETIRVVSLELNTGPFKQEMTAETKAWKQAFGHTLNDKARTDMEQVHAFCEDVTKRLSRKIEDLEDVRNVMGTLKEMRENEIRLDSLMTPIEQSYAMLNKYEVAVQRSETERLDALQYVWSNMRAKATEVQDLLTRIQPDFKNRLQDAVKVFQQDERAFTSDYTIKGPMVAGIAPQEASDRLSAFSMRFDDLFKRYTTYSGGEELFGLAQTDYPDLQRIRKEIGLLQKLYGLYNDVIKGVNGYYDVLWAEVDIERINSELIEFGNRCRKLPKALKDWDAFNELRKTIDDFNECCPLLEAMANPAMLPRHWERIQDTCKHKLDVGSETFQLRNIMEAPLLKYKEEIEDICISAIKERDIDTKLRQIIAEWSVRNLTFMSFKNRGELLLNGGETSELMVIMEDSLMVLSSLMSNRYNAPFKPEIQKWVKQLSDSTEIIEKWLIVQNLWIYLEAVFVGGDIAKQLPQEAKRFANIDKSWIKIMQRAHEIPNLVQCCTGDETMGTMLPHLLEQLEVCQKSLTGYLEQKRLVFPRFFFVSDPALLEILGQASDSHTIQAHLLNIFDNIKTVTFHEKIYDQILAYSSKEGETVVMQKPVMAQGNVEVWLGTLLAEQQRSLHAVICDAAVQAMGENLNLIEFENSFPSQVGIVGIQFLWTRDAEVALTNAKTDKKIMAQMDDKFLLLLSQLIDATLTDLNKVDRVKYETLVTLHVHQRDIFHDLVLMNVKTLTDFEWTKQARFYYLEEERKVNIWITDVMFKYCNEFIGCVERLCVTPLTDRCYITLAQALGMSMGGAPAGPAGTGKTETVKDMGRALGKYVVVFNCSDQMDFRGLGRIYKGLAQSGSWGCFDEFNRIELPVLSVAAQQIAIVLTAKKERKPNFIFMDGDDVTLDPEFGLFLTMNPGYAGRQELPENLKIQFRTVAMMVPDRQIIIRVKLASCGFQNNIILARKFYTLYKLCEEQLTKQVHYDFGLRNILSVLRTLGEAKRQNPEDGEMKIVMRVLRDMNLSKMVDEDEPLFLSLISDLFPGIELDTAGYPELEAAIDKNVQEFGLINHPPWTLKLVQLFETQRVRHGFMVLGPSGAGKTCNINVLMKAMTDNGVPHREMRMNPKAITAPQMFGRLDVATNDWTDGIFSTLWRRTLKAKKGEKMWIVLDGPVDAVWIENLNSVLDDNKMLTLANGDRIPMSPDAKLVFEPHNVDNASPATVSRNGMVFMSPSALDWKPILDSWLKRRPAGEVETIRSCFHGSWDDLITYTRFSLDNKMKLLECNYIKQACDLLSGLIPTVEGGSVPAAQLRRLYVFAAMWSLGAVLELADRAKLQEKMYGLKENPMDLPKLGADESVFEYLVGDDGEWLHWSNRVERYVYPTDSVPAYNGILVPNVDNVRTDFLIHTIAKQRKAVLLIGEQGTAKTVIIKGYCRRYNIEEQLFKNLNFSSTSTPNGFQRTIESYIEKRMGTTYGPPGGKKMTVFIDDINMPRINEWGDQIANEIVRQCMAVNGFYSLDKPGDFTNLADMQWLAAMPHPGGGRNDIPERLKRQFSVFNCTLPSNQSIDLIFRTIGDGYFCAERGFSAEVMETIKKLVPATRRLWQETKVKMLPTPAKFHYVFNLRDVSRIWQGMLVIKAPECTDTSTIVSLWKHECFRVIADRFTNHKDIEWFDKRVHAIVAADLGPEYEAKMLKEPYFVDFLRDAPEPTGEEAEDADLEAPKIYELVPGMETLSAKLTDYQTMYNETVRGSKMDLVFFKDCMTHLVKVSRIIRIPQSNALLVGVGGSGKQSVARLASAIARYQVFQIQLSRSYNAGNLMDDLKTLYRLAGVKGKGVTFILTDNEIKSEDFLEYINNVLATGEVAGLFAKDELDEICSELIPVMKKIFPKVPPTQEALYEFFINRVRSNLHLVLCFSPVGEKFRSRALKFPAVFSGCTMDWFMSWPKDALIAVADHFLGSFEMKCTPEVKQSVVQTMGVVQDGVAQSCSDFFQRFRRQTFVTPASYLSFLNSYRKLYTEKRNQIGELSRRMNTGLAKLVEASASVEQLSIELVVKEKDLAVASAETEKVLAEVAVSAAAAEKVKAEVQKVKDKAQAIVDAIAKDKLVAEGKLAAAAPALAEAEAALQTIKPSDIATVKKLGKPPHLIMRIMDCVLLLFCAPLDPVVADPEKPCPTPTWKEALKVMSGPFLNQLVAFNKDTINAETCELLEPYLSMEDYNLESAKRTAGAVAGLCSWTQAMAFFYTINKEVLPLKAGLAVAEGKLAVATRDLNAAQAELDAKQAELDVVQAKFDETMRKKQALETDAETCKRKMNSASALIGGLGGEKERWTQQSKEFDSQTERLVGDVLVMCAFMSYSGPFNSEFRMLLMDKWRGNLSSLGIPFTRDLNLISQLVDNATIGEWGLQGLPNDDLSLQNGIIVTKATRFPLLIDPQGQGKNWIKNREAQNELTTTSLEHKYFRTHLEDALSLGRPLLLEDVGEELDPCLDNVLERNFIKSGSTFKVKVGDKEVDVMTGFRFYITTKLANPKYTPEVFARTSIIDFTVTMKGLEDQLLARVIQTEKQELETERVALMTEVTSNKKKMKELEDNLLYRLTTTQGSLVDDESLITVLQVTKTTAEEVVEKLAIAADTEIKINSAREEYRPVATRGSILYFLIVEMSMVNSMYQTALEQFLGIFNQSMDLSVKSPVPSKRINNIIDYLTYSAFKYTVRGLYERDKFLFTLMLALKIDLQRGRVKHSEFNCLIKGGAALDLNAVAPKPKAWIQDTTWLNLVQLSSLPKFTDICNQVARNDKAWKAWFDEAEPENAPLPDGYEKLDILGRLLLVRSWCPDRTVAQARRYLAESIGPRFAESVILDMEAMWKESSVRTPMIGLLSMGSDPTAAIQHLAKQNKIECRDVSMGQGQEVHARKLVQTFQQTGGFVLLQNCHLALDFLNELQQMVESAENVHETFRLWITTEAHPRFSINFLQVSIKFTNEPPQGVKANLKRTFAGVTQDQLEICAAPQWKPMLYGVAFLHSVVQERRKFGPLGWNIPYEFNQGDLIASIQAVQNHLDDMDPKRGIMWSAVRYMFGEVHYGGRVTDDRDKRLLNTYCSTWFGEHMFPETFEFYKGYNIPLRAKIEEYRECIEAMALVDSPEVFGLHPNADISFQTTVASETLGTIVDIQPKDSSGGGGVSREDTVTRMCNEFLAKMPPNFVDHEVRGRLKKMGAFTAMNIFLRQEIDRMQRVISRVRTTLTDLILAIDGTIIMSEQLRDALDNMYDARVPRSWTAISWPSTSLGFWFTEMLERHAQFHSWCFEGRPKAFWLTGFFNPAGFITAMRQEITRANKGWALDSVVAANKVTKMATKDEITAPPPAGVYIYGLYLDGAAWDKKNMVLCDPAPKVLFSPLPILHLFAVNSTGERDKKLYQCPVYKKPRRTDLEFISMVELPSAVNPDKWIMRGVALLCDTK